MSNTDGTCEYVLDPDDPETWGGKEGDECYVDEGVLNEDGVWTCPHDAENGKKLCVFHTPTDDKKQKQVVDAFVEKVREGGSRQEEDFQLQFIGAKFKNFELSGIEIGTENNSLLVNLTHSTFIGGTELSDLDIKADFKLNATDFINEFDVFGVKFADRVDLSNARFHNDVFMIKTSFDSIVEFSDVEFRGKLNFKAVNFNDYTLFSGTDFIDSINISSTGFRDDVRFSEADFENKATFVSSEFKSSSWFNNVNFHGGIRFEDIEFEGMAWFRMTTFSDVAKFRSNFNDGATFSGAEFIDKCIFDNSNFEGLTRFENVEFNSDIIFTKADFRDTVVFNEIDLTEAKFSDANLQEADFESALLSRATLFGTDLRGAKLSGAVLGDVRINEDTKFLGDPSDNSDSSLHTISAIRSRPCCVYDPRYGKSRDSIRTRIRRKFSSLASPRDSTDEPNNEHKNVDKAKSVYRALEELGGKHARPRLQARSFVRRQDLQKQDYWDDATADDASFEERFIAGLRWSRAKVARATLLYGESPWRVIAWSLGIIVSFALLYPLGGWMKPTDGDPITYAQIASNPVEILNSVYYSTLTYTALGFGDFQPVGLGRLLTTLETGFGAVMLALLVFILGRRAAR